MKAIELKGVILSNGLFIKYDFDGFIQIIDNNNDIYIGEIIELNENGIMLGNITKNDKSINYEMDFYFDELKDIKFI